MSHICANDEYRSQVGATNRPKNIVIRYSRLSAYKVVDVFSFHLQIFSLIYRSGLRLGADISKVTAHERIQHLCL
jgi:hypothetical protein